MYQGDEIGMANVPIPADRIQDPWEKNVPGLGLGRDPVRTPMQWDASENAGFSSAEPWLPVSSDFAEVNVAAQSDEAGSILSLYCALLRLRRVEPALSIGDYAPFAATDEILAYERSLGARRLLIMLNLTSRSAQITVPHCRVMLSTGSRRSGEEMSASMMIRPNEGLVAEFAA
jgi:alpha-glucosidase